jgi:hypothetical protein
MRNNKVTDFQHTHNFNLEKKSSESKTKIVLMITLTMMIVEMTGLTALRLPLKVLLNFNQIHLRFSWYVREQNTLLNLVT